MNCISCGSDHVEYKTKQLCRKCYRTMHWKGLLNKEQKCLKCEKDHYSKDLCLKHYNQERSKSDRFKELNRISSRRPLNIFRRFKYSNEHRGLVVDLTLEQFEEIKSKPCNYCSGPVPISGGIDRIDSNLGYTYDNCVPCCMMCNILKSNLLSKNEMEKMIQLLQQLRNKTLVWENIESRFLKKYKRNEGREY